MEVWKKIEELNDRYEISSSGKVRKVKEVVIRSNGRRQLINTKVLTPIENKYGYLKVRVQKSVGGSSFNIYIHRLVAKYFIDGYSKELQVNHIDGDKKNNLPDNLEWVTVKENIHHAWRLGLSKATGHKRVVIDGVEYKSLAECANKLSVSRHTVYKRVSKHGYNMTKKQFLGANAILINGTFYRSARAGSIDLGLSRKKLKEIINEQSNH